MATKTIEDIKEKRKAYHRALAFLRRARLAQIPEEHIRINSKEFSKLLDAKYISDNKDAYKKLLGEYDDKSLESFADAVYNNADKILENPYIIIDGGNASARRRAAYALMFRFIISDKWAHYSECVSLAHAFELIDLKSGYTRNDWVEDLKKPDVLYIAEFDSKLFNEHFWVGSFFDDILFNRIVNNKMTLISFMKPISEENKIKDKDCGTSLADLSVRYTPSKKAFRIRVVTYES